MDAAAQFARAAVNTGDLILVGAAGAILVGAGILQKSLGDVAADVDSLPSAAGAKMKREAQRSKRFLNKKDPNKRK